MAHKILGIDLGTYSVKVAELSAGFRQSQLTGLYDEIHQAVVSGNLAIKGRCRGNFRHRGAVPLR